MKKQFFENEKDGFYGTYYENRKGADCAVIGLFGDDPNDYMAKCGAKWLHRQGVNAMCVSPDRKNYSHVNNPLERIQTAIKWLQAHGNRKIGIMGMSTAGMDAIVAASYFPDITMTIGLTASDFVWQGFEQGEKDGCKESRCLICHLSMNIRCIGRRLRRKQKAPVISHGRPACL